MDKDKQIQKVSKLSLEKLSEDSKLVKRGLRDLSIWPKIEELFAKLKLMYESGQIEECVKIAEEILQTDSNHFFTLCYYGRSLFLLGNYEKAMKILDRCLEEEKEYHFLWSFRGDVLYKLGKYEEAAISYDEALKCELYRVWHIAHENTTKSSDSDRNATTPEQLNVLDNYLYYIEEDKTSDEIGYFRKAEFYLSTRAGIYNAYKENDVGIKRAIEALKKVVEFNPKNWYALNQLTGALEFLAKKIVGENNNQALTYIEDALRYAPDNTNLISIKAILLDALGDKEQAIKLIRIAKEKDPTNDDLDNVYQKINNLS